MLLPFIPCVFFFKCVIFVVVYVKKGGSNVMENCTFAFQSLCFGRWAVFDTTTHYSLQTFHAFYICWLQPHSSLPFDTCFNTLWRRHQLWGRWWWPKRINCRIKVIQTLYLSTNTHTLGSFSIDPTSVVGWFVFDWYGAQYSQIVRKYSKWLVTHWIKSTQFIQIQCSSAAVFVS